ncbi:MULTISPECIES: hypothetical protein [unclassified Flavobacterium]|jgi:hypothetical protein|uniref:hypothetical protein n=1 Tax=unclassified Flavobacterium TaxID=196869 RepID=UPI0025C5BAE2|nr:MULTISPECIES: hypothetical protein [unclassified Flavobacterium]
MNYKEALEEIKNKSNLIGRKINNGTIDELIIFPNNEESKLHFKDNYLKTYDAKSSIQPFINEEVSICAVIDKKKILQKIFITATLNEIQNQLEK